MKRRPFHNGVLNHCYQRSADGGVLFYTYGDHLVYFTKYCQSARKYGIQVLALCQMPDHTHDAIQARRKEDLALFKQETNSWYARKLNDFAGTAAPVFESAFGSAQKWGDKKIRTNLIYVGNNPVERKLVCKAEEYRWNYLAHGTSDHPFSEKLVIRNAGWAMRKAVKEILSTYEAGRPLNHQMTGRLFQTLKTQECQQLTDFIIKTYNVIDYETAAGYFGGYDNMLIAMHASTGSEYDIKETFTGKSDICYTRMSRMLQQSGKVKDIHEILSWTQDAKAGCFMYLLQKTDTPPEQIAKFLHLSREMQITNNH